MWETGGKEDVKPQHPKGEWVQMTPNLLICYVFPAPTQGWYVQAMALSQEYHQEHSQSHFITKSQYATLDKTLCKCDMGMGLKK